MSSSHCELSNSWIVAQLLQPLAFESLPLANFQEVCTPGIAANVSAQETEVLDHSHHLSLMMELILDNFWFILKKMGLLFYLVWPTETMFASLGEVPRYVAEVSILMIRAGNGSICWRSKATADLSDDQHI